MKKGLGDAAAVGIVIIIVLAIIAVASLFVFVIQPLQNRNQQLEVKNACTTNNDCPAYSYCSQGTCIKQTQEVIQQNLGVECSGNSYCTGGLICSTKGETYFDILLGKKTCQLQGTVGDKCEKSTDCLNGLQCLDNGFLQSKTCGTPTQVLTMPTFNPADDTSGLTGQNPNGICSATSWIPFLGQLTCGFGLQGIKG